MGLVVGLVLGLALVLPAYAQQSTAKDDKATTNQGQAKEPSQAQKPKTPSRPAQSFTPSERIRADTSVAFPADI